MKLRYQEIEEIILRVIKSEELEDGRNDYEVIKNSKKFLGKLFDYCEGKYTNEVKILSRVYDDRIGYLLYEYLSDKNKSIDTLVALINEYMLDNLGITGAWRYYFIGVFINVFGWDYQLRLSDFINSDKEQYDDISQSIPVEKDVFDVITRVIAVDDRNVIAINQDGNVFSSKRIKDMSSWNQIIQVVAGEGHFAGLKADNTVLDTSQKIQEKVSAWKDIIAIDAGKDFVIALNKEHKVFIAFIWENEEVRQVTDSWSNIIDVSAKDSMIVGLDMNGKVHIGGISHVTSVEFSKSDIVKVVAGGNHVIAIFKDGSIECSGYIGKFDHGQCMLSDFSRIISLSTNPFHTVGVDSNGNCKITPYISIAESDRKYSYGNLNLQLLNNVLTVAASSKFFVGVKNDGSLIWGGHIDKDVENKIRGWRLFSDKDKYISRFIEDK